MQYRRPIGEAPNYTRPALVMAGVNLFNLLFVLWAVFGLAAVLVLAVGLNWVIARMAKRRRG